YRSYPPCQRPFVNSFATAKWLIVSSFRRPRSFTCKGGRIFCLVSSRSRSPKSSVLNPENPRSISARKRRFLFDRAGLRFSIKLERALSQPSFVRNLNLLPDGPLKVGSKI